MQHARAALDDNAPSPAPSREIADLLALMAALRTQGTGCPWDLAQNFASIAPYTIEEAYEVADAIARRDHDDLREELGDLLLQVVFHTRMAQEDGLFDFGDVVESISAKLIRRHPHVFGEVDALDADAVKASWARIKAEEKRAKAAKRGGDAPVAPSTLDGVPLPLPALTRAIKLQAKAAEVGFDWSEARQILDKIAEEIAEVREAIASGERDAMEDEIGDALFAVANLARRLQIDPEAALRRTNAKFERRFRAVEGGLAEQGLSPAQATLDEMEALWIAAKTAERG